MLAWVFGLRHAVDADHIAAIDNVVRKLMRDGQRPATAGLFFALGHSTVVVIASCVTATAGDRLAEIKDYGGTIGTLVSAVFLLLIALINLVILRGVWRGFRHLAAGGTPIAESSNALTAGGGFLARLYRPLLRSIAKPSHMYPIGFLFGLGFDTATEVGLLGISATQAAHGLPPGHTLVFPALFTAGMVLIDTLDSALMVEAYGWAFLQPMRKMWYNLTMTAASVVVAVLIGGLEALGLLSGRLGFEGRFWTAVSDLNADLTNFGFLVVAVFALSLVLSVLLYRWRGYDRLEHESHP